LCAAVDEPRLEPTFLGLFAPVQTAIAAMDAVLAEPVTTEKVAL
jgi:hypothetical protein